MRIKNIFEIISDPNVPKHSKNLRMYFISEESKIVEVKRGWLGI